MANIDPIIIQVKLVMSPEDQKLLGLLTALRKPENAITDVPVQVAPEQELQIAQEAAKCLNSTDNSEMTPELRREWEEWFSVRPQYLHLLKISSSGMFPDIRYITSYHPSTQAEIAKQVAAKLNDDIQSMTVDERRDWLDWFDNHPEYQHLLNFPLQDEIHNT